MDLTNIGLSLRSEHSQESYYDSRTCEALVLCSTPVNLKKIENVTLNLHDRESDVIKLEALLRTLPKTAHTKCPQPTTSFPFVAHPVI
jgi:hypothetical protein